MLTLSLTGSTNIKESKTSNTYISISLNVNFRISIRSERNKVGQQQHYATITYEDA